MDVIKIIAQRFAACLALAATLTAAGMSIAPAHADPPGDWPDCHNRVYSTTFAYSAGSYNVYAGPWLDYDAEQHMVSPTSWCDDITVEVFDTGSFIVRTLVCPKPGYAQFSCYVVQPGDGWGTVTTSIDWGVSLHWYHMPDGLQFLFRVETKNSPESFWVFD